MIFRPELLRKKSRFTTKRSRVVIFFFFFLRSEHIVTFALDPLPISIPCSMSVVSGCLLLVMVGDRVPPPVSHCDRAQPYRLGGLPPFALWSARSSRHRLAHLPSWSSYSPRRQRSEPRTPMSCPSASPAPSSFLASASVPELG